MGLPTVVSGGTGGGRKGLRAEGGGLEPLFQTPLPHFRAHVTGTRRPTGAFGGGGGVLRYPKAYRSK